MTKETNSPTNFFISYNSADREWAVWIAWQLEEAGYSVIIQDWDFRPSENFILKMQEVSKEAERTIAVLSINYLHADFTQPEWAAAFKRDPRGTQGTLLPIMVRDCKQELGGLWSQIIHINLVGLGEGDARKKLLEGINIGRNKPSKPPAFPDAQHVETQEPLFPGNFQNEAPSFLNDKASEAFPITKFSEGKPALPRPKLNKSFNPYKTRDEWIDYITSKLQEAVEREESLDFYTDDAPGYRQVRILSNQNTVYSLDMYKDSMGGNRKDEGISFSYAEGRATFSNGFNAWGQFKWDMEKEMVVLNLNDMGMLSTSYSGDTAYTKEEFLHTLWDKIRSAIERSAHR